MSPFSVEFAKEAFAELEGLAKPIVRCPAILAGFVALATLQPPVPVAAGEENLACPMGREYFLSTPDGIATGPEAAARTAFLAQSVAG